MYFVQQWYGLAAEAVKDAVYGSQALRKFMDIDLRIWHATKFNPPFLRFGSCGMRPDNAISMVPQLAASR